jgi:hypothetical protein
MRLIPKISPRTLVEIGGLPAKLDSECTAADPNDPHRFIVIAGDASRSVALRPAVFVLSPSMAPTFPERP